NDFDRIFRGADLDLGGDERIDEGVQGGRLASAARPRDHEQPGARFEQRLELFTVGVGEGELGQVPERGRAYQLQHDVFAAVEARERVDHELDAALTEPEARLAALGEAAFGGVEVRHGHEARERWAGDLGREGFHGDAAAVDAKAHDDSGVGGLEVNVGSAAL